MLVKKIADYQAQSRQIASLTSCVNYYEQAAQKEKRECAAGFL